MKNSTGGKGSVSRPLSVPLEEFGNKHTAIFGERKRTNGGWTPPPLPTDDATQQKVDLPSGATVTMRVLKERPQTDGDYKFQLDSNITFADNPRVAEDGMAIPD